MTVLDRQPPVSEPPDPPRRRDRTHWLYIAVIVAVVAGVAVGLIAPDVGKSVGVLGTMFVALIKMMIAPVIFCTIMLGIGSVRKAATVGKVGGLAFVCFLAMSSFGCDRPARRQPHPPRQRHAPVGQRGGGAELAERRTSRVG
jgi:aerobic C4-dicarboxylate transport protein